MWPKNKVLGPNFLQEMELSKQEMELFYSLLGLWSKNVFYEMFHIFLKDFKLIFKTENEIIQTGNGIDFHFQASNQKKSFTRCFIFLARSLKLIFRTGNRIIQTGNEIISPTGLS